MKRPKYGGRVKGTPNKKTAERDAAFAKVQQELADQFGDDFFDGDALALMMTVYKNGKLPIELRLDAAKTAVGYERPRLQAVAVSNLDDNRLVVEIVDFTQPPAPLIEAQPAAPMAQIPAISASEPEQDEN